jgi:hypothetical protein
MSKKAKHYILGIRHHGPGSCRSVMHALDELQPDAIAIEWPNDKDSALADMAHTELRPPIAQLQYLKQQPEQVSLLPLAELSPEWQAMQWAFSQEIPLYAIDLPFSIQQQIDVSPSRPTTEFGLQQVAQMAGFDTIESFWDHYFERETQSLEDFELLLTLMKEVRWNQQEDTLNELREAHMRRELLRHSKKHNILVTIVGAFHGPALQNIDAERMKKDNALLKGWREKRVISSIIPFSYPRLSRSSGYGAGVESPQLYDIMFHHQEKTPEVWLSQSARLLREEGFHVSPSEVQAAVNLSRQLAQLRNMNIPGQKELIQATEPTLCRGQKAPFELIRQQAVIGTSIGHVPRELIHSPVLEEFLSRIKSLRLSPYWAPKTPSKKSQTKELDLRKNLHRECSQWLHLIQLMGLSWAQKIDSSQRSRGSFREVWQFQWDIEHEIQLFQWSTLGSQLSEVAMHLLEQRWNSMPGLKVLIRDLDIALLADFQASLPLLLRHIEKATGTTDDLLEFLPANTTLLNIAAYGNVRDQDQTKVRSIAHRLHRKICSLLPYQSRNLKDEVSRDLFQELSKYSPLLHSSNNEAERVDWQHALQLMLNEEDTDPRLSGFSLRSLLDSRSADKFNFSSHISRNLQATHQPEATAQWLEGLLYGTATLLLYHDELFEHLQRWIDRMPEHIFNSILPVLNRTFSEYPLKDRQLLWQKITQPAETTSHSLADHYRTFALLRLLTPSSKKG